jgi:hypothetical protein
MRVLEINYYLTTPDHQEVLIEEPIGWQDGDINVVRSENYHGVFYEYKSDLRFIGNGARILKEAVDKYGFSAKCFVRVEIKTVLSTNNLLYQVSFSNWEISHKEYSYVKVDLEKTSMYTALAAEWDTEVELNIAEIQTRPNAAGPVQDIEVELKSLPLYYLHHQATTFYFQDTNFWLTFTAIFVLINLPKEEEYRRVILSGDFNRTFGTRILEEYPLAVESTSYVSNPLIKQLMDEYYKIAVAKKRVKVGRIEIVGNITLTLGYWFIKYIKHLNSSGLAKYLSLQIYKTFNTHNDLSILFEKRLDLVDANGTILGEDIGDGNYRFTFTFDEVQLVNTIFEANECVGFCILSLLHPSLIRTTVEVTYSNFEIKILTREDFPSKVVRGFTVKSVTENLFKAAGVARMQSDYFDRDFLSLEDKELQNVIVLSGKMLRGVERVMRTSLKDFFDELIKIVPLGYALLEDDGEVIVRVEPPEYFYNDMIITDLGDAKSLTESIDATYMYKSIEFGFEKYGGEEGERNINTLDIIHGDRTYVGKNQAFGNRVSLKSKLICDSYAIEFTKNKGDADNADRSWKFDNDLFLIEFRSDLVDGFYRHVSVTDSMYFDSIRNTINAGEHKNPKFMPMRNFLRLVPWRFPDLYRDTNQGVFISNFSNNSKYSNKALVPFKGDYSGEVYAEDQPVYWSNGNLVNDVGEPKFHPIKITFEIDMTMELFERIRTDFNIQSGLFSVTCLGKRYEGYLRSINYSYIKGIAKVELLKKFDIINICNMQYVDDMYIDCRYFE